MKIGNCEICGAVIDNDHLETYVVPSLGVLVCKGYCEKVYKEKVEAQKAAERAQREADYQARLTAERNERNAAMSNNTQSTYQNYQSNTSTSYSNTGSGPGCIAWLIFWPFLGWHRIFWKNRSWTTRIIGLVVLGILAIIGYYLPD